MADLGSSVPAGEPLAGGGSGAFAAPELAPGAAAHPAQDVFALGVVLAALVTGRAPGRGAVLADRGVSPRLAAVVAAATAEAPGDRQPTAAAFWAALAGCPEAARQAGGRLGPF